jgi:putative tryptophan/tyrosine transport system substrate-binding protein
VAVASCGDSDGDDASPTASSSTSSGSTSSGSTGAGSEAPDSFDVGVLQIAEAAVLDDIVAAFQDRLTEELAPGTVDFDLQNAQGDQSLIASLARNFAASDADAFAVLGTPAVIAMAQQITDRPIIAIAMGDPVGAGVADSLEAPGGNVTGSIDYVDPALILEQLLTASPMPRRLGTVFDPSNQNMQVWIADLTAAVEAEGDLELVEATVSGPGDVATAARSLDGRVDAILIGPDATVIGGVEAVGAAAASAGVPLYVAGGEASIDGVLASIGPDYPLVGELAAEAASTVLRGTPPGEVPFGEPSGVLLQINQATMDALGVTFPPDVLEGAT